MRPRIIPVLLLDSRKRLVKTRQFTKKYMLAIPSTSSASSTRRRSTKIASSISTLALKGADPTWGL